jgi:hypothetical protein
VQLLETPAFKENTIDTSWLDGLIKEKAVGWKLEAHEVHILHKTYKIHMFMLMRCTRTSTRLHTAHKGSVCLTAIQCLCVGVMYSSFFGFQ